MLNLELNKRLLFYSCIATLFPTLWWSSTKSTKGGNERPDSAAVSAVGSAQSRLANSPQCLSGKTYLDSTFTDRVYCQNTWLPRLPFSTSKISIFKHSFQKERLYWALHLSRYNIT
jgi:hypothetical protein